MNKRKMLLGGYDTAQDGLWTLTAWSFSAPAYEQNFVKIPGSSVTLDMSTVNTDGEPAYDSRTLTADFESSEGTRMERKARIDYMLNALDGRRVDIILPDDPERYISGRLSVRENYNDLAHASVSIEVICDPWKYAAVETVVSLPATTARATVTLTNGGRKPVIPVVEVSSNGTQVYIGDSSHVLDAGTHILPDLYLTAGRHEIGYANTSGIILTYREAVL